MKPQGHVASFEVLPNERARIVGALDLTTVSALLPAGSDPIARGQTALIDLAGVTHGDSAGLALLIEWLSVAQGAKRTLRYENVPSQLLQLARLSEVEAMIAPRC